MFRCLACGYPTLTEPPGGTFDICSNCGWEDDNVQASDHSFAGGANAPNMEDHRRAHLEALAIQAFWDAGGVHGRPHIEVRIPDWPAVGLDEGAAWYGSRVDNGWYVRYRVCVKDVVDVSIWMKYWEFGEDEPPFAAGACPERG